MGQGKGDVEALRHGLQQGNALGKHFGANTVAWEATHGKVRQAWGG
jgi:hypothetical protein